MELFQQNVVVTANSFNVTVVNQLWLDRNRIIVEEEFGEGSVFTPALVQVTNPKFQFLVIPNQIQFTPTVEDNEQQELIVDRLGRFITLLPHTPYSGLGLNFIWHYRPSGRSLQEIGKSMFFKSDTPFARAFDRPDAKFGAYYSKDELGFRLKLAIHPVDLARPGVPTEEIFQFSFNYHLGPQSAADTAAALSRWNEAKHNSISLITEIEAAL